MPLSLKEHVIQFLEYAEIERHRSKRTVRNYGFYLNRFLMWARNHRITEPEQVTLEAMHSFRWWLNRLGGDTPLKSNTQNYHLIALRTFLRYLATRDIQSLAEEKIELVKNQKRPVDFLDGDDLERLLSMPSKGGTSDSIQKRDRAILELLFSTGLRVSELSSLTRDAINLDKNEFTVRGKGDKYRSVFLSPRAIVHLNAYLRSRRDLFSPLFIRHDRAFSAGLRAEAKREDHSCNLTPRSIQRLVQHYAKAAGIEKTITPHVMRHSFAADQLRSGADIRSVQTLLGHSNVVTTTQIYARRTNAQPREAHKTLRRKKAKK